MAVATMQMLGVGEGPCGTPGPRRSYLSQSGTDSIKKARAISRNDIKRVRIKINVSGTIYETLASTLSRYPDTLLGNEVRRAMHYDNKRHCLYFNRYRAAFEAILFYYQSGGCLICPTEMSMQDFENECKFFGLDEDDVWLMKEREGFSRPPVLKQKKIANSIRSKIYEFLEDPSSSKPAGVFAILLMIMIVGSISMTCVTTLPNIQKDLDPADIKGNPISLTELIINSFFCLEIVLKFLTTPERLKFIKSPMNAIDALAVFPYFIAFAVDAKQLSTLAFVKVFRTVRVLRLLRFSKHSDTLRVVINILSSSVRDLFTVVFCMLLMSIMWGSLAFYVEVSDANSQFTSIPEGMWWAIQTIVCLGYGDIIPVTLPGKIAASVVAVIGALTLTVPLLSIGGRYLTIYSKTFEVKSMLIDNNNSNSNSDGGKGGGTLLGSSSSK